MKAIIYHDHSDRQQDRYRTMAEMRGMTNELRKRDPAEIFQR